MIKRVKYWCLVVFFFFLIIYTPRYVSSDEKGIESAAGKTGQDVKCQVKWLGLSMRLLDTH
jgi:hypothetical protein